MEEDRYRTNNKLYIIGILSLLLSLSLLAFSLYILPHLLFGWRYDTPEFLMTLRTWLETSYNFTEVGAARFALTLFFLFTILFGIIAYITSNRVDDEIYEEELEEGQPTQPITQRKDVSESISFSLKVFFIVMVVILVAILFELALRSTSPGPLGEGRQFVN